MNPVAYNVDYIKPLEGLQRGVAVGDALIQARLGQEKGVLTNEALGIENLTLEEKNRLLNEQLRLGNKSVEIGNLTLEEKNRLINEQTRVGNKAERIENVTARETNELENERRRLENEALRRAGLATEEEEEIEAEEDARITELFDKIYNGTATPQDYQILSALLPEEQSKAVRESLAIMSTQQQEREVAEMAPIFAAFHSGSTDIGVDLLKQQAEAYRNAGATKQADIFDSMVTVAESGPEGAATVQAYIGYLMTELPGGTDIMEGAKTYWEIEKIRAELEALVNPETGTLSTEDIFRMETTLRTEYTRQSQALKLARLDYDKALASAATGTGAGDVALVFGFMRMLDPGSVVRESEFAQARDTAGLWESLKVQYAKLMVGESLSPIQRASFLSLSEEFMAASEEDAKKAYEDIRIVAKNYGLNEENIFGLEAERLEAAAVEAAASARPGAIDLAGLRRFIVTNNPGTNTNVATMTAEQIRTSFPNGYAAYTAQQPSAESIDVDW